MLLKALISVSLFYSVICDDNVQGTLSYSVSNIEILINLLNSTKIALKVYDQKLDKSIPWENLSNAINIMGLDLNDYSSDAVNHVVNAGQSIRLGLDKSYQETRKVLGWTVFTKTVLESYLHVINITNFTDTSVIFETIDRSLNLFTNAIIGFDSVINHFSNAVSELEMLENQLISDKRTGSSFMLNKIKNIRITTNYKSPEIATFSGVLEFLQQIDLCKCKDIMNDILGSPLEYEIRTKHELVQKRLDIIEKMYDDIKKEIKDVIANIREFRRQMEKEIRSMREYKDQMEYNDVNFQNFPIIKDIHGPIIKNLIIDCEAYIQYQNINNKLH